MLPAVTRFPASLVLLLTCMLPGGRATSSELEGRDVIARFEAISSKFQKDLIAIRRKVEQEYDPQKSREEQQELFDSVQSKSNELTDAATSQVFELVSSHAAEFWAAEPLAWVAVRRSSPQSVPALELLAEHHLLHPKTIEHMAALSRQDFPAVTKMLHDQLASPELPAEHRFKLTFHLADQLKRRVMAIDAMAHTPQVERDKYRVALGTAGKPGTLASDAAEVEAEAIALYRELAKRYGDENLSHGQTVAEVAKGAIFELQHLRIGMVAPDLIGEDLDGNPLKLSDYQGKIILLDFWASWCGPCMAEVPHLRGLATKFKDQPFAIVGVNGDPELSKAQHAVEEFDIPWRSYWCGDKGPDGEIPRSWNVRGWPTVYVLDGNRVIRAKQVYGESLEERILQLLSDHDPIQSK